MRIRVNEAPLQHGPSGLKAWAPGEHEFPEDPAYAGWLQGQVERGAVSILPAAAPEPPAIPGMKPEVAEELDMTRPDQTDALGNTLAKDGSEKLYPSEIPQDEADAEEPPVDPPKKDKPAGRQGRRKQGDRLA